MLVTAKVNVRSTFCLRLHSVTTPGKHYPCFWGIFAFPLSCDFLTLKIIVDLLEPVWSDTRHTPVPDASETVDVEVASS